jgi:uncharacterized protein
MAADGVRGDDIDTVVWQNRVAFFSQSGRLDLTEPVAEPPGSFEGNVIARGDRPEH